MKSEIYNLRKIALETFDEVLINVDAKESVRQSVRLKGSKLQIHNQSFNLSQFTEINVIGFGKAANSMAAGLNEILDNRIKQAVISSTKSHNSFPPNWKLFTGGHPIPNVDSFNAARAAITLLEKANHENSLFIFLISGGGSAMCEVPKDEDIELGDLQITNKLLVGCGASIAEINTVRRYLSKVKGGGLANFAPLATQISLIISDVNQGDEANVASGPTISSSNARNSANDIQSIILRYNLNELLPKNVSKALEGLSTHSFLPKERNRKHSIFRLLDNKTAVDSVVKSLESRGFLTNTAEDLTESPIHDGCRELVKRLLDLRQNSLGKPVAIISGGEFSCPVRGSGIGGRNLEATLRCVLEIEAMSRNKFPFVILNVGTDGIDGNSPASGAIADHTTIERAQAMNLNACEYLQNSDAYSYFSPLNDTIMTGATDTNVRDIRILLAL